jgi:hypothetical protein
MAFTVDGELFDYRIRVVFDKDQIDANMTNRHCMLDLSALPSIGFWDIIDSIGGDLRMTSSDGTTRLPLEIRLKYFDTGTETGILFFKAPSLSSSVDTIFYLYFGNPTATQPAIDSTYGAENVYRSNAKLCLPMDHTGNGSSYDILDSTSNDNDAKRHGVITLVDGVFGKALQFDDLIFDPYLEILTDPSLEGMSALSVSCWFKKHDTPGNFANFVYKGDPDNTNRQYSLQYDGSSPLKGVSEIVTDWSGGPDVKVRKTDAAFSADTWYLFAATWDSTTLKIYVDGILQTAAATGSGSGAIDNLSTHMTIGRGAVSVGGASCESCVHEIMVEDVDNPPAWWAFTDVNQRTPALSYSYGDIEGLFKANVQVI